jgi:hypothetical protein
VLPRRSDVSAADAVPPPPPKPVVREPEPAGDEGDGESFWSKVKRGLTGGA